MRRQGAPERAQDVQDASPQVGKGHSHTEVSSELLEAVYRFPFTGPQLRLILAVMRDSYGWKRKVTRSLTTRQWATETAMPRATLARVRSELDSLGVIEFDAPTGGLVLRKNYLAWGKAPQLELSTGYPQPGDNSVSTIGVPLVSCPTGERPTGERKASTGERLATTSGTHYGETKGKKKERGADGTRPAPQNLPNGRNDTPTERARLGDWSYAPQDHPGFARLSFKLQDALAEEWRNNAETKRKAAACKNGCGRPKAAEAWPYCRPCTACSACGAVADGARTFAVVAGAITCNSCKEAAP